MNSTKTKHSAIHIGCAGWSIPKDSTSDFAATGSHLQRYARRFNAVEINSSFYRPHRTSTYSKWAAVVPGHFRFSVKLPRAITHEGRLRNGDAALDAFFEQVAGLGEKLGCVLVQLPPAAPYDARVASTFFKRLRQYWVGPVAIEPRHASWFGPDANALFIDFEAGRVAADPPKGSPSAAAPGGHPGTIYFRLHGSPKIYYSTYSDVYLEALATRLRSAATRSDPWCIFDNTASGEATKNALVLTETVTSSK